MKTIIKKIKGHSALVRFEQDGDIRAVYINRSKLQGSSYRVGDAIEIPQSEIDTGIPYGVEFDVFLPEGGYTITARVVQNAFRASGIWTINDILNKPQAAIGALRGIIQLSYSVIVNAVRRIQNE